MTTQFDLDKAFTARQRALIEQRLYATWGPYVSLGESGGSMWLQRHAHIDAVVERAGRSLTVEEKIVRRAYPAFAVETHANLEKSLAAGQPDGWLWTSTADLLLYAFSHPFGLETYVMGLPELRAWFGARESVFRAVDTPNVRQGRLLFTSRCRLAPVAAVQAALHVEAYWLHDNRDLSGGEHAFPARDPAPARAAGPNPG